MGYSDLFIKNAKALDVDLGSVNTIVISHSHDDHTRGLKYYFQQNNKKNISIISHPDAFKEKLSGNLKICSPVLEEELKEKCNLILSKEPKKVSKNIIFLGEIPQIDNFENRKPFAKQIVNGTSTDDYLNG